MSFVTIDINDGSLDASPEEKHDNRVHIAAAIKSSASSHIDFLERDVAPTEFII